MTVSIAGLDKTALLQALYERARPQGMGILRYDFEERPLSPEVAAAALAGGYIDYLGGRSLKVDLSGDEVDPWLYDRDNGAGALAEVVQRLREAL